MQLLLQHFEKSTGNFFVNYLCFIKKNKLILAELSLESKNRIKHLGQILCG